MRVVALQTIPHRWLVHQSLELRGVLVRVAGEAQRLWLRGGQLDPRNILVYSNFVARGAPHRNRRVHRLTLGLLRVTFQALRRIRILLQRHWMDVRLRRHDSRQQKHNRTPQQDCQVPCGRGYTHRHPVNPAFTCRACALAGIRLETSFFSLPQPRSPARTSAEVKPTATNNSSTMYATRWERFVFVTVMPFSLSITTGINKFHPILVPRELRVSLSWKLVERVGRTALCG